MNITIVSVGKLKEKFWKDACDEYLKRLKAYAKVEVKEVPDLDPAKCGGEELAVLREGAELLKAIPEKSFVILLAIEGREVTSEQIASYIDNLGIRGTSRIAFVIGGSCGVSDDVRERADMSLSFGPITLPHNLARIVLLEQIYRAYRIIRGEAYHK